MNTTYELLDGFRDAVQGWVIGRGINFEDAVFYSMAAMTDREICTLADESRHYAKTLAATCDWLTDGPEATLVKDWERVSMSCRRVLNTRHANRIKASYDALVDDGWHGKGIQL